MVVPLLTVLAFGMVEFGTAWRDSLTVSSATRAGARVVSSLGDERLADYQTLLSVQSALDAVDPAAIEGVLIYDASATDGAVPAGCLPAGVPRALSGQCNYYTGAQLASLDESDHSAFSGTTSCDPGSWDEEWCPLTRVTSQGAGLDYVGIRVVMTHELVTGLFPISDLTITESAVMRVEPR